MGQVVLLGSYFLVGCFFCFFASLLRKYKRYKVMSNNVEYLYLARWAEGQSEGVVRKIKDTVSSITRLGALAAADVIAEKGLKGELFFLKKLIVSRPKVLILRARPFYMGLYFPFLLIKRLQRVVVVIDVPTPIAAVINEVRAEEKSKFLTSLKVMLIYFSCPVGLWAGNRVLQYAPDSNFFSFGLKKRTRLIANGIDVNSVPRRSRVPVLLDELTFIGVAQLAEWHGYDRLIEAVHQYNKSSSSLKCVFLIVGEGPAKEKLQSLHLSLGGGEAVRFLGFKKGAELDLLFETAHVGVCSLGLYRLGLQDAAILKAREYVARGIPMLLCGNDLDFKGEIPFVARVENSGSEIDLHAVFEWYRRLSAQGDQLVSGIRRYAVEYLDFDKKIKNSFWIS